MSEANSSRRDFIRTTAYVAPAILTLKATPAFAQTGSLRLQGSGRGNGVGNNGVGNHIDPQPRGNPPVNDGPGTNPGNPGNRGHGRGAGGG